MVCYGELAGVSVDAQFVQSVWVGATSVVAVVCRLYRRSDGHSAASGRGVWVRVPPAFRLELARRTRRVGHPAARCSSFSLCFAALCVQTVECCGGSWTG